MTQGPSSRATAFVAIVVAIAMFVSGCGSSSNDTSATEATLSNANVEEGTPTPGGNIVMAVTAETNGWNPALAQWADAGNFVGSSFLESLLVYNAQGDQVPWLADSVTPDSDAFDVWTVKVHPGITFHDGSELGAADVKASLDLAINEGLAGVALKSYYDRTDVVDQYTAKIYLTIKWATFPTVLAGPTGYVMAQSMIDQDDRGASNPIGTGPYDFDSWVPDQAVKVSQFDAYWGGPCALPEPQESQKQLCAEAGVPLGQPNGPFLEAMEFRPIIDSQQRASALESGDVNIVLTTRATDVARLKNEYTTVTNYDGEQTLVMMSVTTPPFDNVHARRAVAYATNRQPIIDLVSAGEPIVSDEWPFSASSKWGANAAGDTGYPSYDPAKAAEELELYKQDTGEESLSFSFSGLANTDDLAIQQTLLEQWAEVGIDARIETIEQTAYIGRLVAGDFEAAYFRNYAYPDPDSLYSFWSSTTAGGPISINFTQYYSDATDAALTTGRETTDFETRRAAYDEIMRERNEQAIELWLFNTPYALIAEPDIHGLNWFRIMGFGNFLPKPWIGGLWIQS
jgi:peptide/nickel transport system substrate-binding protein